jgi:F-type H+-transporting ATPase subunit delta
MQAEPIVVKFVQLLVGRGRLETLAGVRDVFSKLVDARLNRMTAEVTTALPLTQGQENRILAGLTSYTKQMVRITTATDPDIIGGIVVRLNGTIIDGSLRTRLDRAKQMLLAEEHEG